MYFLFSNEAYSEANLLLRLMHKCETILFIRKIPRNPEKCLINYHMSHFGHQCKDVIFVMVCLPDLNPTAVLYFILNQLSLIKATDLRCPTQVVKPFVMSCGLMGICVILHSLIEIRYGRYFLNEHYVRFRST